MAKMMRCRRCSGIIQADNFAVEEACRCETPRGRKARSVALNGAEEGRAAQERPASLRELLSDPGLVW